MAAKNVFRSISDLNKKVESLIVSDQVDILRRGYPNCYKSTNNCNKKCRFNEECSSMIIFDQNILKKWGL